MVRTMKNIEIIGVTKEIWYTVVEKMRGKVVWSFHWGGQNGSH